MGIGRVSLIAFSISILVLASFSANEKAYGGGIGFCLDSSDCDDSNVCTVDICDNFSCLNAPIGGSCDDGEFCTTGDTCSSGVCVGGSPTDCSDGNVCTEDLCNETIDTCENPDEEDGTPCGNPLVCFMGSCVADGAESVGGTFIQPDKTVLLLAGAQSISMWMIPVVVTGIGIGVFVVIRRK